MFKRPVNIAFSPNFERDDVLLAWELLLGRLEKQEAKNSVDELKKWFINYTGHKYVFCFSSGRAGLFFLLKSLELENNDEVLTQAFTCVAVPNSIIWASLRPIFADINKLSYNFDINDVKKKLSTKTRAIIIQHTFGIPGPIDEVLKIAKEKNLIVIEDCAHALGARYKNKNVGSYGNVSFFSLGRDKVVSSVFGGVVTTSDPKLAQKLGQYEKELIPAQKRFVITQLIYPILYAISLPLYPILFGRLLVRGFALLGMLTPAVFSEEKKTKQPEMVNYSFSSLLATLALNQLKKLSSFNNHRINLARAYQQRLGGKPLAPGAVYLRYPLVVKNKRLVLETAKKNNIYLGDWYDSPIYPVKNLGAVFYEPRSCPTAERLARVTINLPTHINTSVQDAIRVADLIKMYDNKNN